VITFGWNCRSQLPERATLTMLWDEYIERCPQGYRYSRFCEL
jgi:transposase